MKYKEMLEYINDLVENDFCAEMDYKNFSEEKFTQEEARAMAEIIDKVYSKSHSIHCKACGEKYT